MAAQELRRQQEGARVWGCGQSLSAPLLVYTVPRTPPAGLHQVPSILGRHPDLGLSLTLEEAFSCTRTSASFTSNKTSCRGDEGEEALISTALSSVFNQTLARDYPNAEVMKHSQPQLFQVSSVLPFFPHHPVLPHFNLFTNNSPKAQTTAT